MLIPQRWNLTLYPGLQFDPLLLFYSDDARVVPFPLAGYSAQLNIGNGLLVLTSGSGLTLGLGSVQVRATATQTAPVPVGELDWFLEWTPPAGQPDCPAAGTVTVQSPPKGS